MEIDISFFPVQIFLSVPVLLEKRRSGNEPLVDFCHKLS